MSGNQPDAAIARVKEVVEIDPKMAGAYVLLAKAYNQSSNHDLGRQAADKASELGTQARFLDQLRPCITFCQAVNVLL
jgi:Tfp pilus assembly protein PilF